MRFVPGDGVELAVLDEGEGRPVLLLHGFPDTARLWRHQVRALTQTGMRAIAPDMRGRGQSQRPAAVEDYAISRSIADMVGLLDGLEVERADVVAHDFGAVVAWGLAARHPERVRRLVVMSVGHPATYRHRTMEDREKAWYQLLFQFRDVAEELLQRDDWRLFREWLREDGDVDDYISDLSRADALSAALNYYRANLAPHLELQRRGGGPPAPIAADTLGLWSTGDHYLTERRMIASGEYVTGGWRYERIEGASHWMQLDQPERINELLREFLA